MVRSIRSIRPATRAASSFACAVPQRAALGDSLMEIRRRRASSRSAHRLFAGCSARRWHRAQYLLARYAFETLGYRRYEWKCNALNTASRRAALRYGFTFEGIFRQHMIAKGRNRDTAWFSMLDSEWPTRKANFERWLAPENFSKSGEQKTSLAAMNAAK